MAVIGVSIYDLKKLDVFKGFEDIALVPAFQYLAKGIIDDMEAREYLKVFDDIGGIISLPKGIIGSYQSENIECEYNLVVVNEKPFTEMTSGIQFEGLGAHLMQTDLSTSY